MKSTVITILGISCATAQQQFRPENDSVRHLLNLQGQMIDEIDNNRTDNSVDENIFGLDKLGLGGSGKDQPHLPYQPDKCPKGFTFFKTKDKHAACKMPPAYSRGLGSMYPDPT